MTTKERLRQLVEELPEEIPETAITAVETALGPYVTTRERRVETPANGHRVLTLEERRARVKAARGCAAGAPGSVEDFLQRKQEDIRLEGEQSGVDTLPPTSAE